MFDLSSTAFETKYHTPCKDVYKTITDLLKNEQQEPTQKERKRIGLNYT
ncbi:MAG: hypothetical protein RIQ70_807 [Bacteroidota bacterium]|jgi:hypothetical protein